MVHTTEMLVVMISDKSSVVLHARPFAKQK